jgi:tetratricopeptide (TPR) repeat protein
MNEQLQSAIVLVETGQTETGLNKMRTLLNESDDDSKFQIASYFQEWGLIDEATEIYQRLAERYPNDSHLILQIAEISIDNDDEEKAIDWLARIHPLDENYLSAQVLLADLYQSQGLEEVAEQKLTKALEMAPHEPVLIFALAEFYSSVGEASKASSLYKKVLHVETLAHENIELKLGEALSLNGQFEEAMIYYDKGIEKQPTLDGLFGYAVTALQAEKYQTAIQMLEKLKEMDDQYTTLYPVLAEAYEQEGMIEEAIDTLDKGILADEHNARLYYKAAELSQKIHKDNEAAIYFRRLLKIDPENVAALKKYISLLIKQEDYEAVTVHLEDAHEDPALTWDLALAYKSLEQDDKALELYRTVAPEFQQEPDFLYQYGELLWLLGKKEEAAVILKKALLLDPDNYELAAFVERIEQDF